MDSGCPRFDADHIGAIEDTTPASAAGRREELRHKPSPSPMRFRIEGLWQRHRLPRLKSEVSKKDAR